MASASSARIGVRARHRFLEFMFGSSQTQPGLAKIKKTSHEPFSSEVPRIRYAAPVTVWRSPSISAGALGYGMCSRGARHTAGRAERAGAGQKHRARDRGEDFPRLSVHLAKGPLCTGG